MASPPISCPDFLRTKPHRRHFLRVGGLGLAGLTFRHLLPMEARAATQRRATARNVILLFQFGGPSHLDTFDPNPSAPPEIRGEFASIPTAVPGVRVTEHLPRLAHLAGKY